MKSPSPHPYRGAFPTPVKITFQLTLPAAPCFSSTLSPKQQAVTRLAHRSELFHLWPAKKPRPPRYSQGGDSRDLARAVAKLNQGNQWTSRQASALVPNGFEPDGFDEDDAYLRPESVPRKPPRSTRRAAKRELVPNYDPAEDTETYLRTRRRVPPRKGGRLRSLARSRFGRILLGLAFFTALAGLAAAAWAVRSFLQHDPRFRIDSSANIQATGVTELTRPELMTVFGSDIGRNIFFVPLARREAALEAQPWVRHATVMRILPDSLRVPIEERVPIAFVRIGRQIQLADRDGMLLSMPPATLAARHYSFPVVVGLDPNSPPQARADRMRLFQSFVAALDSKSDSAAANISSQLSEVDLTDLDDIRAVVPAQGTDILLHFGDSDFLERYLSYKEHLPEWRQQYPNLSAVDLRYDRQVVLKMADAAQADEAAESKPLPGPAPKPTLKTTAKPALKPAHRIAGKPAHTPLNPKPGAHHPAAKRTWYTQARSGPYRPAHWVAHTLPASAAGPNANTARPQ